VYITPCVFDIALQYFKRSLSLSFELMAMSDKNGVISSARHLGRVRNSSENLAAGSAGRADAGKYFRLIVAAA
jgi:hypothetical protein